MLYIIERELQGKKITIEILNSRIIRLLPKFPVDISVDSSGKINKLLFCNSDINICIGDIIKVPIQNINTGFYVSNMIMERDGCYTVTATKNTKSKHFILPFLGDTKNQYGLDTFLENVYLDFTNSEIDPYLKNKVLYLHYRVFNCNEFIKIDSWLLSNKNFVTTLVGESYHITYVMKIPDTFIKDVNIFKSGKYSKFSKEAKERILTFHSFKEDGITGQILYNNPKLRKQLELEFNIPLPENIELFDIPEMAEETYTSVYDESRRRINL